MEMFILTVRTINDYRNAAHRASYMMDNNFDNPNKIFKKEYNKFYKKHSKINNK
jgi:hypothetical protein